MRNVYPSMPKLINLCFLGAGAYTSSLCSRKKGPFVSGVLATSSLFYIGSLVEFDNLITDQPVQKSSYGYWMFKCGLFGAGLASGSLISGLAEKGHNRVLHIDRLRRANLARKASGKR